MTLSVTRLARTCHLSRSTVLYYESIGLLPRPKRTTGNYRVYGPRDLDRLRQICVYRDAGLTLQDIRSLLDAPRNDAASVLRKRMAEIAASIQRLKEHQSAIARLLQSSAQKGNEMISKEKWTQIMAAAGLSDEDMRRWHIEFERAAPAEHQEFLEFLHIPPPEIASIREWSARGAR